MGWPTAPPPAPALRKAPSMGWRALLLMRAFPVGRGLAPEGGSVWVTEAASILAAVEIQGGRKRAAEALEHGSSSSPGENNNIWGKKTNSIRKP